MSTGPLGEEDGFPTTHWSLIARAGQDDPEARRRALGDLLARYAPALRAHLVSIRRLPDDLAEDLVQEFIADKVLERHLIARADQRVGKFRSFLLTALNNYVKSFARRHHARRRWPSGGLLALGDRTDELPRIDEPSAAYDAAWARSLLQETLRRMQTECEQMGRMDVWHVFRCRILDPILENTPPLDYRQMVERFGFRSPTQAANILVTAKRMYARILRLLIGQYAVNEEEIEAEIAALKGLLGRPQ